MGVETPEFIGAVRRMIGAAGRRVNDDWELAELVELQSALDEALQTAVDNMRARGMSWQYVADGLGTTRQAAFERFRKRPNFS